FVTGSTSSFSYQQAFNPVTKKAGGLTTTYQLQTQVRQTGRGPIHHSPPPALFLHPSLNLSADAPASPALTNFDSASPRGTRRVWAGPVCHTVLTYAGTLPETPPLPTTINNTGTDQPTAHPDAYLWTTFLLPLLRSVSAANQIDGRLTLTTIFPNTNNYLEGQSMYGVMQLVPILLEISKSNDSQLTPQDKALAGNLAEQVFNQVKNRMSAWLSASDDQAIKLLYYQPKTLQEMGKSALGPGWQSLISILDGFQSSEGLNDHNLIGGYFLKTAALIAQ